MKKLIALALSFILLASTMTAALAAPATSDEAMTDRLTAITLKVKETLGIGDSFTSFNGNLNEMETASLWTLNWRSDSEQIYVTANENGTIVSYDENIVRVAPQQYSRIPRFPAMSLEEAKTVAEAFLKKVLDTEVLSVDLEGTSSLDYSGSAMYYLSGPIKLHGIETPIGISVSVSAATKEVASFYRNDYGQDYGSAALPSAATGKSAAAEALKGTLNMKLTYALPGDGSQTARLQYTPDPEGSFVVDAVTGELVDLNTLDWGQSYDRYEPSKEAAADTALGGTGSAAITPVEQATIDQLQGVLSQSALEAAVRAYPELGLTNFVLQNVNYYTYKDAEEETRITAYLQFMYTPEDAPSQYRSVSMDAKTGALFSVGGSYIYYEKAEAPASYKYTDAQTEEVARTFAGKILPDKLGETALSGDTAAPDGSGVRSYVFCRVHENIPFPENYISVGVDAETGFVVSFNYSWYEDAVTFVSPDGAISADTAAEKYSAGAGTALRYISVPASYQESGLLLSYTAADNSIWGVNALTGALLKSTGSNEETALTYDDLAGNPYAAMIEKLAFYGVGFPGGSFKPSTRLTQLDALILIESTNGPTFLPLKGDAAADDRTIDDIYSMAYSMGILTPDEKNPAKEISRAEYVKYLINAMGYKEAALLLGIYSPGFKDDKDIPAGLVGYMALGKGFGIIKGDQNGNCLPNNTATRLQAAIMLYNCMSRK